MPRTTIERIKLPRILGSNSCQDLGQILGKNLSWQELGKIPAKILSRFSLGKILQRILAKSCQILARPYQELRLEQSWQDLMRSCQDLGEILLILQIFYCCLSYRHRIDFQYKHWQYFERKKYYSKHSQLEVPTRW